MSQKKEFYQKDILDNLVKAVFWTIGIVFSFLMFLTLFQCSLKKPSSPTWETDLILPLINKTYDMVTIIEETDEPSLYVDSSGELCFSRVVDLDTTRIEELLTFPHSSYQVKEDLGVLKIESPEPRQTEFILTEVYQGDVGLVPPFSFALNKGLERISTFSSATIDQGKAFVSAENHLSLNLDSLKIDIIDYESMRIVETVVFQEGLRDGEVDTQEIDLREKTLSNHISYSIQAHTPGGTILSLSEKYLILGFFFSDSIFISEALAQIPEIQIEKTENFKIPTDDIIQRAVIKSGQVSLDIYNHTNLLSELRIEISEFSLEGIPLSINRSLLPGERVYEVIPLEHYIFQPASGRELNVDLHAITESTGTQQVWIFSSDSIVVQANLSQLTFSEVTEIPEPTLVKIDPIQKEIDLPQGFDAAHFPQASLSLEITSGVNLPGELQVQIKGDKGQLLNLSGNIEAGSASQPFKTIIIEDDLSQFSNPLPSQITIGGDVSFGDGVTSATITEQDFVIGKVIIRSPLELILDSTQIQIDEGEDSLDKDERELVGERLQNTKIVSRFENHLPLDAEVELYLKIDPGVYAQPDLLIGPIDLNSGEVNEHGNVIASTFSQNVIQLDKEKLKIFESAPFYVGGKIRFPGTEGEKVKFRSTDYIKVSSYLEVRVKAGE
jgi:hypothetical protein